MVLVCDSWNLGTMETILRRFAANSVPLLHLIIELRFIKLNLTSRAYQTKSSPLEGLSVC